MERRRCKEEEKSSGATHISSMLNPIGFCFVGYAIVLLSEDDLMDKMHEMRHCSVQIFITM